MATTGFEWITIEGFKSILSIQELPLRGINILVDANGSGKSIFFRRLYFSAQPRQVKTTPTSNTMAEPKDFCITVQFYALPHSWPGRAMAVAEQGASRRAEHVEAALLADLVQTAGSRFNPRRFIPFVVMHEFEGLLCSHPGTFANAISRPDLAPAFEEIRKPSETPEDIHDFEHTAPSKQILAVYPKYQKPLQGIQAASAICLSTIRSECPHFHDWLSRLEALPLQLQIPRAYASPPPQRLCS
jgi:hypothetical protein